MRTKTVTFELANGEKIERTVQDDTFHATSVQRTGSHGYPFRAECGTCDWKSNTYASAEAAGNMGWAHTADDL